MNAISTTKTNVSVKKTIISSFTTLTTITTEYPNIYSEVVGQTIACSSDGVYISLCASGVILSSTNSGASFTTTSLTAIYSVAMNATGQYQMAVSVGNPACNIYISVDYGVTWTNNKANYTVANNGRWLVGICVDATGQYMYAGGGGTAGQHLLYSKNYGTTWVQITGIFNRVSATMNNTTMRVLAVDYFNNKIETTILLDTTPTEVVYQTSLIAGTYRITSDGGNNVVCNSSSVTTLAVSTDGGATFTSTTSSPVLLTFIYYSGSILWGCSASTIYKSSNNGSTWTTVVSGLSIKSMIPVLNNTKIYITYTTGEVIAYIP